MLLSVPHAWESLSHCSHPNEKVGGRQKHQSLLWKTHRVPWCPPQHKIASQENSRVRIGVRHCREVYSIFVQTLLVTGQVEQNPSLPVFANPVYSIFIQTLLVTGRVEQNPSLPVPTFKQLFLNEQYRDIPSILSFFKGFVLRGLGGLPESRRSRITMASSMKCKLCAIKYLGVQCEKFMSY